MQTQKIKSKKKFSDGQIRSLESIFDSDSRPESGTKKEIADQLGLEPRQVAVWFQNRRARCKSKQIEHDYSVLKSSYDSLASKLASLKRENQSLAVELQRLQNLKGKSKGRNNGGSKSGTIISLGSSEEHAALQGGNDKDKTSSGNGHTKGREYLQQCTDTYSGLDAMDSSQVSSQNCCSFESMLGSDCLLEKNSDSEWWEFLA
ncbi:hypothetical protein Nepgr_024652 [Nepenthes gracilis]|uniref:Homeobox-leucine zipper protein n=1 Tax=Nepenthes gracilis TaxID=150966 RepID=A0AAD3T4X0_NEPGR|nr:hypothetical protein Nepgr_024652 [Nepenthes gracilis]